MDPRAKPIPKRGQRNIYCPFYNDCLDHAVKNLWQCWSCAECPHRKIKSVDELEYEADDGEVCYEISPDMVREMRKDPVC